MKGNVVKIALFDPYGGKFTDGMQKWWESHGHEVKYNRYYNPEYALWADVIWFDTADNNVMSGTNPGDALMDDAAKSHLSPHRHRGLAGAYGRCPVRCYR